jgi:hypothetical protein
LNQLKVCSHLSIPQNQNSLLSDQKVETNGLGTIAVKVPDDVYFAASAALAAQPSPQPLPPGAADIAERGVQLGEEILRLNRPNFL